ncbi:MAG: hemerythrin domain-containing protein [Planctomycetes bacterium]|nr:hemerythrin domain-containing protein [Planctomycetota bacterium]
MRSIQTIRDEHEVLNAVLDQFEELLTLAARDDQIDVALFGDVLDWFDHFAEGIHQDKEELGIFPPLLDASPEAGRDALCELIALHIEERAKLAALRENMEGAAHGDALSRDRLLLAARAYVEFQRHHARLEDDVILPLADRVLPPDSDDEILATFDRLERCAHAPRQGDPRGFLARLETRTTALRRTARALRGDTYSDCDEFEPRLLTVG